MEKGQFIEVEAFDADSVDCDSAPQTAEQYLKQVMVSRSRCPQVVHVKVAERQISVADTPSGSSVCTIRDERAADTEWQAAKSADFGEKRSKLEMARGVVKKMKISWPYAGEEAKWEELMLGRCHPDLVHLLDHFPNHIATPPALSVVFSLSPTQVNALIPYFVDWAESESLTRPIREWLYALMLVLETPVLHDVIAALRQLVKMCRDVRGQLSMDRTADIAEMSLLIAVVSLYFGQKDLAD